MSKDTSFIIMSGYFHGPANPESCLELVLTQVYIEREFPIITISKAAFANNEDKILD